MREIAEETTPSESIAEETQFLSFLISNEVFGVDLLRVHEILRLVYVTRIPNVDESIIGVVNLRGEIIPVVDLKKKFEQGFTSITPTARFIVTEIGTKRVGILVEEVRQVIKIRKDSISEITDSLSSNFNNLVGHVGRNEGRLVLLIELSKIIQLEE
ncbi:MAG: chemotaxis protein CheW [Leptospiraceae bacterium]|nr:purine-binding chemotaxis protein CheW [Leptospiraceae bacterium]MCK6380992.1 chemotaxis protein CheW [Leptospiraceae bacterium]NUM40255.1 purine-binding chemotaxis protein CheW [Leptospiraceae bacterium]